MSGIVNLVRSGVHLTKTNSYGDKPFKPSEAKAFIGYAPVEANNSHL